MYKNYFNMGGAYMKMTVVLPVKPTASNATSVSSDGKTLEWDLLNLGPDQTIHLEFSLINMWLIAGICAAVFVLILIIVLIIVLASRKKKASQMQYGGYYQPMNGYQQHGQYNNMQGYQQPGQYNNMQGYRNPTYQPYQEPAYQQPPVFQQPQQPQQPANPISSEDRP